MKPSVTELGILGKGTPILIDIRTCVSHDVFMLCTINFILLSVGVHRPRNYILMILDYLITDSMCNYLIGWYHDMGWIVQQDTPSYLQSISMYLLRPPFWYVLLRLIR